MPVIRTMYKLTKTVLLINYFKRKKYIEKFMKKIDIANAENKARIFIFNKPEHGNLGDQAIGMAQRQLLKKYDKNYMVIELATEECNLMHDVIKDVLRDDDVLIIYDGGFIGTLWEVEHESVVKALTIGKNNLVILLPHVIYFNDTNYGKKLTEEFKTLIHSMDKLHLFLRDQKTYDFVINTLKFDKNRSYIAPDLVAMLKVDLEEVERKGVLFCLRTDREKIENKNLKELESYIVKNNYDVTYTNTVIKNHLDEDTREPYVIDLLKVFKQHKLLVTDRLHGMLFGLITGTPCIAFDNVSKKVSGVYNLYLKDLPTVYFYNPNEEIDFSLVEKLMNINNHKFDSNYLQHYYDQIYNVLDENLKRK